MSPAPIPSTNTQNKHLSYKTEQRRRSEIPFLALCSSHMRLISNRMQNFTEYRVLENLVTISKDSFLGNKREEECWPNWESGVRVGLEECWTILWILYSKKSSTLIPFFFAGLSNPKYGVINAALGWVGSVCYEF